MLEFKTIQILKSDTEILEVIKDYKYKVKNGKVKHLLHMNLQVIEPTGYLIIYPTASTILEYRVNEIIRNKETGHSEIEPIEAQVVKEIFELCKQSKLARSIATTMKDNNAYLKTGNWTTDRVYKILTNSIYIGIFEYGKYCRKPQDILRIENYCEPIIDIHTWNASRKVLEKNKHSNYVEHIHLFTGIVRCPACGKYYLLQTYLSIVELQKKNYTIII